MNFKEIANDFNKLAQDKKMQNGVYLRTIMLFYAYCKLIPEKCTVQNATEYLRTSFDIDKPNSASMSRNNAVLIKLGLIILRKNEDDDRSKEAILTPLGEKYKRLFK
jgi:DNA-binding MarR family transcriptional regulator